MLNSTLSNCVTNAFHVSWTHPIYLTNIGGQTMARIKAPGKIHRKPNTAENRTKKQKTMPSSQITNVVKLNNNNFKRIVNCLWTALHTFAAPWHRHTSSVHAQTRHDFSYLSLLFFYVIFSPLLFFRTIALLLHPWLPGSMGECHRIIHLWGEVWQVAESHGHVLVSSSFEGNLETKKIQSISCSRQLVTHFSYWIRQQNAHVG